MTARLTLEANGKAQIDIKVNSWSEYDKQVEVFKAMCKLIDGETIIYLTIESNFNKWKRKNK